MFRIVAAAGRGNGGRGEEEPADGPTVAPVSGGGPSKFREFNVFLEPQFVVLGAVPKMNAERTGNKDDNKDDSGGEDGDDGVFRIGILRFVPDEEFQSLR